MGASDAHRNSRHRTHGYVGGQAAVAALGLVVGADRQDLQPAQPILSWGRESLGSLQALWYGCLMSVAERGPGMR